MMLIPLFLLACGEPKPLVCDGESTVVVDDGDLDIVVRGDLAVTGTASQSGGFAIRSVRIGGIAADNTGFNFEAWSATVPLDVLVASAESSGADAATGLATLEVESVDACGVTTRSAAVQVTVDLTPDVIISQGDLQLTLEDTPGLGYLPADGSELAAVEVCAPADAVDTELSLQSSQGDFVGTLDGDKVVLTSGACLATGESDAAVANAFFVAGATTSTAFVSATGGGATDSDEIEIAGAPTVVPATAELAVGQTLVAQVFSDGLVASCTAYGADPTAMAAYLDGDATRSLYDGEAVNDTVIGTDHTLTLTASGTAAASVSVVCCDAFDQCSAPATFSLAGS